MNKHHICKKNVCCFEFKLEEQLRLQGTLDIFSKVTSCLQHAFLSISGMLWTPWRLSPSFRRKSNQEMIATFFEKPVYISILFSISIPNNQFHPVLPYALSSVPKIGSERGAGSTVWQDHFRSTECSAVIHKHRGSSRQCTSLGLFWKVTL